MVDEQDRSVNRRRWACAVAAAVLLAPTTLSIVSLGVRSLQQPWWFGRGGVGYLALSGGIAGVIRVAPLVAFALFYAVRPGGAMAVWLWTARPTVGVSV